MFEQCSHYFNLESKILHIPEETVCKFTKELIWRQNIIEEIYIEGEMNIEQADIHIKFKYLTFGEKGMLKIFNDPQNNQKQKVIFDQLIDEKDCQRDQLIPRGYIKIISQFQIRHITLEDYAQKEYNKVQLNEGINQFSLGQEIILLAFGRVLDEIQYNTIQQITLNEIILEKNIELPYQIPFLPKPMLISHLNKERGVIFYNSCLALSFVEIEGVQFINPQYLIIKKGYVDKSLFTSTKELDYNLQQEQKVSISCSISYSTFIDLTIVETPIRKEIKSNVFIRIKHLLLRSNTQLEAINYFMYSRIQSDLDNLTIKAISLILSNSIIFIKNQIRQKNLYFLNSLFINQSEIILNKDVHKVKFNNITFINSSILQTQYANISQIIIDSSYIYNNNQNSFYSNEMLNQQQMNSYHLSIQIRDTIITGYYKNIFNSINSEDYQQPDFCSKNKQLFQVLLTNAKFNILNEDWYYASKLFNLPCQQIKILQDNDQYYTLYDIQQINLKYPHMLRLNFQYFTLYQFLLKHPPSYYRILEVEFLQNVNYHTLQIRANDNVQIIENEQIKRIYSQIMPNQEHEIVFFDDQNRQLEILSIKLEVQNQYPYIDCFQTNYTIRFIQGQHAMSNITISQEDKENNFEDTNDNQFQVDNQQQFYIENNYNSFKFQWQCSIQEKIQLKISMKLCDIFQFSDLNQCVNSCQNKYIVGSYCTEECSNGLFINQITGQCNFCPQGCKNCDNTDVCTECQVNYNQIDNECKQNCDQQTFQSNGQCKNCQQNCKSCSNKETCNICFNQLYNPKCQSCQDGYYFEQDQCKRCQFECQKCSGGSQYECTKCKSQFTKKFGICAHIN